jgi:hypothetical protein
VFRQAFLVVMATAAPLTVLAQGLLPNPPYYAINPNQPFAPSPQSPVQQQVLENYRTQLLQTQREMLQQNPPGLSRDQIEVNRQVNAFTPGNNPANPDFSPPPTPRLGSRGPYFLPQARDPETWVHREQVPTRRDTGAPKPKHRLPRILRDVHARSGDAG